jgi:hypothetical protein
LITGDFNMSGTNSREYAEIKRVMDGLDMHDLWNWDVYGNDPTEGYTCRFTDGDRSSWQRDFSGTCTISEQPNLELPWREYCGDKVPHDQPPRGVGRYDYVFVERPKPSHVYRLEVSRTLRRPFSLGSEVEGERYLSDHLGMDLTLYLSPR